MIRRLISSLILPPEISDFERTHIGRMNRIALVFFMAHVPLLAGVAALCGTGAIKAAALSLATLALPALAYRGFSNPRHVSLVFGVTAMCFCALLVHFGRGPMQIEMHFYFFVTLALLAVFANPMVIIVSAITVAAHHLILFLILPASVFNYEATIWSVLVHALFVVLESIAACFVARSFFDNVVGLEKIVDARTVELRRETEERKRSEVRNARIAGMAEVATGVLHNVGNALNSVNVSVSMLSSRLGQSKLPGLGKATGLLREHASDPGAFFAGPQGKQLVGYLDKLAVALLDEQSAAVGEVSNLNKAVSHLTAIISAQQTFAKAGSRGSATEVVTPASVVEEAIALTAPGDRQSGVELISQLEAIEPLPLDRHRLIQMLVNLINNARQAVKDNREVGRIEVSVARTAAGELHFRVRDNGVGITAEQRVKIFSHGFTTRTEGHGFGLHASACAAMEMGGTLTCDSEGAGRGSTFTIVLPFAQPVTPARAQAREAA